MSTETKAFGETERWVRQNQFQCNINAGSISNLQEKEAKFLAYVKDNNNKRNSTQSTPACVMKLDWIQSDHFWSYPSFKQSSTINDLLDIFLETKNLNVYALYFLY